MTPSKTIHHAVGLGLKMQHCPYILHHQPAVAWFEVHLENLKSGAALDAVESIRELYPLSVHSVGLSLGSHTIDKEHLSFLKHMIKRLDPGLVSDHVSWSFHEGVYMNELLPLPHTEETLRLLVRNITHVQDFLETEILVENPATYLSFSTSLYDECDFMVELLNQSRCGFLLDINNVYVNAYHHKTDAKHYIQRLAQTRHVKELHLSGHKRTLFQDRELLIDDHGSPVSEEVWDLYAYSLSLIGPIPTLIEWDNNIPPFETLWEESQKATCLMERAYASLPTAIYS